MIPHKIILLYLICADSSIFLLELIHLNKNLDIQYNENVRYKAIVNKLEESNHCEFNLVFQSEPHIVIYRFVDKLVDIPK
jgi:hypothetical protein